MPFAAGVAQGEAVTATQLQEAEDEYAMRQRRRQRAFAAACSFAKSK